MLTDTETEINANTVNIPTLHWNYTGTGLGSMGSNILCRNVHPGPMQLLIPGPIVSNCSFSNSLYHPCPGPRVEREDFAFRIFTLMCFCLFFRYRSIVPVFTQPVGSAWRVGPVAMLLHFML